MTERRCIRLERLREYSVPLFPPESHGTKKTMDHQEERLARATWKAFYVSRENPLLAPIPEVAIITLIASTGLGQ